MKKMIIILCMLACALFAAPSVERYNIIWDSPSKDASGQMPLGNGDVAAGVYAIEDGDLYLLLAKNDAFNYSGDIFKTGRAKISLSPNPFAKGKPFKQVLDLANGSIRIDADGISIRVWADANRPVYHVEIDSPKEIAVTMAADLWERIDGTAYNCTKEPLDKPTQDVLLHGNGHIINYFAVGDRSVYPSDLKYYEVEHMADKFADPYRFNTFGNLYESPDLKLTDSVLSGKGKNFDLRIHAHCAQEADSDKWVAHLETIAAKPVNAGSDWKAHCKWWSNFWNRSWIMVSDNSVPPEKQGQVAHEGYTSTLKVVDGGSLVGQGYNVFRYIMACQSRGRIQTKFNGGLFTQPLRYGGRPKNRVVVEKNGVCFSHEDERLWGRRFTFQNQRLLYWPTLMSGDGDLLMPFFDYYWDMLPMRTAITKAWFGHEGTYYRENMEPTGGERDCGRTGKPMKVKPGENKGQGYYHSFYFTCGLETVAMMIEYVKFTGDEDFRDRVLVPFAREILLFFDKHYPREPDGKLRIDPAMVVETFWVAVNPATDVAGLLHNLDGLLAMGAGTTEDQKHWKRFRVEIPEVHLHEIDGRKAIAPAQEWSVKRNSENGELYPVFPFQRFGVALGTADIAAWTVQHRTCRNMEHRCWGQDQIHWACSGNAEHAQSGLVRRYMRASRYCRFPLYGDEGPDSCPDFDHFGAGSTALQRMLVQEGNGKIHLLPAWPDTWDTEFKLHLSGQTVISGEVKEGVLKGWSIEPKSRRKDVVVYEPQKIPVKPFLPPNNHPLRLGMDSSRGSRFKGEFGRVSMIKGCIDEGRISKLAYGKHDAAVSGDDVIFSEINPGIGELTKDQSLFAEPFSLEAWIKPGAAENGRIFDKLQVGNNAGVLLDTYPNLSLRLIVNQVLIQTPDNKLTANKWHHVALVFNANEAALYLDGTRVE